MRSEITQRNIIFVILLTYLTLGIYGIYLYFAFNSELRRESIRENLVTEMKGPWLALFLALITFGIYGVYYIYKQAVVLDELGRKYNYKTFDPILILILVLFFGFGFILNIYSGSKIAELKMREYSY